jgi:hypothetical protein
VRRLLVLLLSLATLLPAAPAARAYTITSFVLRGSHTASVTIKLKHEMWLRDGTYEGAAGTYTGVLIQDASGEVLYASFDVPGVSDRPFVYSASDLRFKAGTTLRFTMLADKPGEWRWKMFLAGRTQIHYPKGKVALSGGSLRTPGGTVDLGARALRTTARSVILGIYTDDPAPTVALLDEVCLVPHGQDCLQGTKASADTGGGRELVHLVGVEALLYLPGHHPGGAQDVVSQRVTPDGSGHRKLFVLSVN